MRVVFDSGLRKGVANGVSFFDTESCMQAALDGMTENVPHSTDQEFERIWQASTSICSHYLPNRYETWLNP
jgi:hypothetical protein